MIPPVCLQWSNHARSRRTESRRDGSISAGIEAGRVTSMIKSRRSRQVYIRHKAASSRMALGQDAPWSRFLAGQRTTYGCSLHGGSEHRSSHNCRCRNFVARPKPPHCRGPVRRLDSSLPGFCRDVRGYATQWRPQ